MLYSGYNGFINLVISFYFGVFVKWFEELSK